MLPHAAWGLSFPVCVCTSQEALLWVGRRHGMCLVQCSARDRHEEGELLYSFHCSARDPSVVGSCPDRDHQNKLPSFLLFPSNQE